ncbi:CapA family protein [Pontibacter locisalis]|uniref:CapA family protein n=1 Tax=Pontibacter locisalis TaxID=1719035 RepID=A0ABW5IMX6_9BACT
MVKLLLTGDFCPINKIEDVYLKGSAINPFLEFRKEFKDIDLHITNLECPLTDHLSPISKNGPNLAASTRAVGALKEAKVDVACLANNHILDHGSTALLNTIDVCTANGIKTVGAGKNIEQASKILYLNVKGKKIALVNLAENEFTIANKLMAGANPLSITQGFKQVKEAERNSDFVIVIIHGGNEFYKYPSPRMVETYRFFAENGASVVVGHHTHCISGYEIYNNIPIFYSLGNFVFDWKNKRHKSWYSGIALNLFIKDDNKVEFRIKPFSQNDGFVGIKFLDPEEENTILEEIFEINKVIINQDLLEKEWNQFCYKMGPYYLSTIFNLSRIERKLLKLKFFSNIFIKGNRKIKTLNMIQCEAHKDILLNLLNK